MIWYPAFLGCVALLWLVAAKADLHALRVILVAAAISHAVAVLVTAQVPGHWKLVVPAGNELMTIMALYQWARNASGYWQACCSFVAMVVHSLCYVDLAANTDLVYSQYENILLVIAIAQLLGFHETAKAIYRFSSLLLPAVRRCGIRNIADVFDYCIRNSESVGKGTETASRTEVT